jgi:hypothetical protein
MMHTHMTFNQTTKGYYIGEIPQIESIIILELYLICYRIHTLHRCLVKKVFLGLPFDKKTDMDLPKKNVTI